MEEMVCSLCVAFNNVFSHHPLTHAKNNPKSNFKERRISYQLFQAWHNEAVNIFLLKWNKQPQIIIMYLFSVITLQGIFSIIDLQHIL